MTTIALDNWVSATDEIEQARRARREAEGVTAQAARTAEAMAPVWDRLFTRTHADRFGEDYEIALTLRPRGD